MGASASAGANEALGKTPGTTGSRMACPVKVTITTRGKQSLPVWTRCSVCNQRDAESSQVCQEEEEVLVEPVSVLGELRFLPSPRSNNGNALCSPLQQLAGMSEPSELLPPPSEVDSMAVNFSPRRSASQFSCPLPMSPIAPPRSPGPLPLSPEPVVASEGGLGALPGCQVGSSTSVTPARPLGPGTAFTPQAVMAMPAMAPVAAVATPPPTIAVTTSPQQRSPYRGGVLSLFTPSPSTPPCRRAPFDLAGALPEGVNVQDMSEEAQLELAIAVSLHEAPGVRGASLPLRPAETCHAAHAAQLGPAQPAQPVCLSI